jgi:hypothetical protein
VEHNKNSRMRNWFLLTVSIAFLGSCASMKTSQDQYVESVPLAVEGAYDQAALIIEAAKEEQYKEKDRVLYFLDLGMLYHWSGEYELSNQMLSAAESAIEELFTKSVSKALTSGVLNDNALDYSGEDYEDIYLNVFKALNYIALDDEESALVEIRRVQIKLNLLEDKYKELIDEYNASEDAEGTLEPRENRFHNAVLARYLSLLLYRSQGDVDDARIDRESMEEAWQSQAQIYNFPKPEFPLEEAPDDKALVNILTFTGLSPVKLADTLYLTTGPGVVYIAMTGQSEDYVTDMVGFNVLPMPGIEGGIHFKIQFPRLTERGSDVTHAVVKFDGNIVGETAKIESIEGIARETFLLKQPLIVGKTIIRAAAKNIAKEIGKDKMQDNLADQGTGGLLLGILAGVAADVAVDSTENADLRISQFFPARAGVVEIETEPGTYDVTVEYMNGNGVVSVMNHGPMEFFAGELNLVESYILR